MKILAILLNIVAPGVGTLFVKKWWQAIFQIILVAIAFTLNATGLGAVVGIPIWFIAFVWAIISAASYQPQATMYAGSK